ncbi:MAG: cytochrome c maturation protein CcmE, partial [Flavobacteriales bacterium]|nr:cytochrome c maturation protein CcmE [Flavobacteriales bacterium]
KSQEVIYDPQSDHSTTIFYMIDKNDEVRKVHLKQAKPQGLERSESVDLYGKVIDGEFYATDILMKCPSKYNENNHLIETAEAIN